MNTDINTMENVSTKNCPPDTATIQQRQVNTFAVWPISPGTREEILERVEESLELRNSYCRLSAPLRERFIDFLRGARTLPLTYDPFFKAIFDPKLHPERLSGLISSLLGIPVKVKEILPTEDRMPETYIHRGRITFDTGLEMEFLQEYCLVALDVFRQIPYAVDRNEQTVWLSLLVTETVEEAEELMTEYPWLKEIYKEIAMLRQKPEEVLHMFSEALRIMDRNTVKYMVEEQQKELEEQRKELEEQRKQLSEKDQEIHMLREQLAKERSNR